MTFEEKDRPVLEEHAVPERRGMLGGRSIHSTQEGKLERTRFVTACDCCGHYPLDEFVVCRNCRGKLCVDECANWLDGRPYCRSCLAEILPVSRNSYKVLTCIEGGIVSVGKISDLTRIDKDEIRKSLALLTELGLVERKGALAFTERKVTADGVRALAIYQKVYRNDEDVNEVRCKVDEENEDGS